MKSTSRVIIYSLSALILFCAGCATKQAYDGERLVAENVAAINPVWHMFITTRLVAVDGIKLGINETSVEVLPGKHTLKVVVIQSAGDLEGNVSFEAKPGEIYTVHGRQGSGWKLFLWVKENSTGKIIVGREPKFSELL